MRSYRKWQEVTSVTWPEVTSPEVTWLFPRIFSRILPYFIFTYFFPVLFHRIFFRTFCSCTFFPYFFPRTFFPRIFFLVHFFSYYFPVLFQKSRPLKSNVLKYQLVVFLEHVVITQFMFLGNIHSKVTRRASPGCVGCTHASSIEAPSTSHLWGCCVGVPEVIACAGATGSCITGYDITGSCITGSCITGSYITGSREPEMKGR